MTTFANDSAWKPVHIGAGGFLTGIDVAPDGTMVARTDTYGAYLWNGTGWTQLVTSNSMPANVLFSYGVYEIRVSASNSSVMYMEMADGIYKTTDKGQHWLKTNFPSLVIDPNGNNRMDGQKMAIDPNNPNIVFAGTQHDGLWVTRDGGSSWQKIAAVPQGPSTDDPALTGIVVQGSNVYVGTAGSGVYASHDGGYTWSAIGGPADLVAAVVSRDGTYWAADETGLWKYANGSWTKSLDDSHSGVHSISIDPFNIAHIIVTNDGGGIQESNDGGVTWSGQNWYNQLESGSDVPWLQSTNRYMGNGGTIFDPLVPGKLWQSAGVGVWETQLPSNFTWQTPVIWHSQSQGIEQLVANDIIAPAGGDPVFGSWDRAFFAMSNVDTYATNYSGGDFSMGWSLDYASSNPHFVVGLSDWWGTENSGFSTDGGHTWQKFATYPTFAGQTIGGSIAASSPSNFIWAPANGFAPAYTLDGGASWHTVTIPGKSDWSLFHYAYYLERTTITADRVLPNTFYLYDSASGVYRSSDGGVTWNKVFNGEITIFSASNAKIEAVPGHAGELFFTGGPQGSDGSVVPGMLNFMHSTDGGASWQAVTGVQAITFGYGAAATQGGPATVYVVGTVNGAYGVWYSIDDGTNWTKIGEHPAGSLDTIRTVSGDMDIFGRVYVGFGGSGYAYLDVGSGATSVVTPPAPTVVTPPPPVVTPPPPVVTTPPPPVATIPDGAAITGNEVDNVLVGIGSHDQISGLGGNDTITGGGTADGDVLTGGAGNDTFLDTRAGLNGDTITDFATGDRIVFSDATVAGFSFSLAGNVLTYTGGSLTLNGVTGNLVASAAAGGGVQLALQPPASQLLINDVRNDFNGDGRSDILWRNADGRISDWLGNANGGFTPNDANAMVANVATGWTIVGTGDFNGDGRDDVLWRNSGGALSDWLSNASGGFTPNDANALINVATNWTVAGVGDFNGDGRDDILWRSTTGQVSDWLGQANGGFANNDSAAMSGATTDWHVAGIGDFNGDGRDDILWRNDAGQVSDWLGQADGGFVANDSAALVSVPTSWHIVGTGDFNGDGRDDILWRNDTGQISDWLGQANGGFVSNDANALIGAPIGWGVAAVGDYNGDGRDDILWRDSSGHLSNWLATPTGGFVNNDSHALTTVSADWHVQPDAPLL